MRLTKISTLFLLSFLISLPLLLFACSGSGGYRSTTVYTGYRHYHGSPWRGYRPIYVVPGPDYSEIDPDWGVDPGGPVALPLPDMGMPDFDFDMMDF